MVASVSLPDPPKVGTGLCAVPNLASWRRGSARDQWFLTPPPDESRRLDPENDLALGFWYRRNPEHLKSHMLLPLMS